MKKLKELYSSPTTELLVVRFEGSLLTGTNQTEVEGNRGDPYDYYDLDEED